MTNVPKRKQSLLFILLNSYLIFNQHYFDIKYLQLLIFSNVTSSLCPLFDVFVSPESFFESIFQLSLLFNSLHLILLHFLQ